MLSFKVYNSINNILVVAPHADDEILACGGLLHKLKRTRRDDVTITIALLTYNDACENSGENRIIKEFVKAARIIGADKIILPNEKLTKELELIDLKNDLSSLGGDPFEAFWDNFIPPNGDTIKSITKFIRLCDADLVITTHPNDFHTDHRNVAIAAKEACYQAGRRFVFEENKEYFKNPLLLYGYVDIEFNSLFKPDFIFELDEIDVETKKKALHIYDSFAELIGKGDLPENIKTLKGDKVLMDFVYISTRMFGGMINSKFGEAFQIGNIKPLKLQI